MLTAIKNLETRWVIEAANIGLHLTAFGAGMLARLVQARDLVFARSPASRNSGLPGVLGRDVKGSKSRQTVNFSYKLESI
jgi:hypothetical protein